MIDDAIETLSVQPDHLREVTKKVDHNAEISKKVDLIDRQATIDALTHKWDGMVTSVFDVVNSLPSAQPAIIYCRDCKHLFKDNKCPLRTWWTHTEDDFCSKGERRTDESD